MNTSLDRSYISGASGYQYDGRVQMDGKRDYRCRVPADVIFAACYGFSSCAVIHAVSLVWVADRRGTGCHYLRFYTDCAIADNLGRIFPGHPVEQQCCLAYLYLSAPKQRIIARRAYNLEKKDLMRMEESG